MSEGRKEEQNFLGFFRSHGFTLKVLWPRMQRDPLPAALRSKVLYAASAASTLMSAAVTAASRAGVGRRSSLLKRLEQSLKRRKRVLERAGQRLEWWRSASRSPTPRVGHVRARRGQASHRRRPAPSTASNWSVEIRRRRPHARIHAHHDGLAVARGRRPSAAPDTCRAGRRCLAAFFGVLPASGRDRIRHAVDRRRRVANDPRRSDAGPVSLAGAARPDPVVGNVAARDRRLVRIVAA